VRIGLNQPSGIAITESTLFVSDHKTGEIIAYDLETAAEVLVLEDLLVEEISIDGMCGVY
jgi:mycofactocin precursor